MSENKYTIGVDYLIRERERDISIYKLLCKIIKGSHWPI